VSRNFRGHTFVFNIINKYKIFIYILSPKSYFFLCKKSIDDIKDKDKISIQINEDNKNYSRKDNEERFYEWLAGFIDGMAVFYYPKKDMLV